MVRCINAHNVNQALSEGLRLLAHSGQLQDSRNGPVLVAPGPVVTTYKDPTARVLFSPLRDANPFFHVMEALWMLAGRNDLPWLAQFNKGMTKYSDDDGRTQPGAYGYRWRKHFGYDQLGFIYKLLREHPGTRRAVLTMWAGGPQDYRGAEQWMSDLENARSGADVPCNTQAYFGINDGRLDMTVTCRSNDIWWGAYGANAVHFSFMQEYMAAMVGVEMGEYVQFSNNYHLYPGAIPGYSGQTLELEKLADDARQNDAYTIPEGPHTPRNREPERKLRRVPLVTNPVTFEAELKAWMNMPFGTHDNVFFNDVACPMLSSWKTFKQGDYAAAIGHAEHIKSADWSIACVEWLQRRHARKLEKERTVV